MNFLIKKSNFLNNFNSILFFILILGLFLFDRYFSHINIKIANFPFYVTELFLIISFFLIFTENFFFKKKIYVNLSQKKEFLLFYIIFIISLIRGLINYDIQFALRQSAIIYYSAFYFIIPILLNSLRKIEIYFYILFISTFLLIILRVSDIRIIGLGNFYYYYISISFILLLFYSIIFNNKIIKLLSIILIILYLLISINSKVRTSWVGLFLAIIFISFLYFKSPFLRMDLKKIFALGIMIFLILVIILSIFLIFNPKTIDSIKNEFKSLYNFNKMNTPSANNVKWRLMVWGDIFRESLEKPLLGHGFGKPFLSESLRECNWLTPGESWMDPHNSYLSILYRTGIFGLLIFLFIVIRFFYITVNFINKCRNRKIKVYVSGLLTTIVYILVTSFFMVVLEGPFLGVFLWINMGIVAALIRIEKNKIKFNVALNE